MARVAESPNSITLKKEKEERERLKIT